MVYLGYTTLAGTQTVGFRVITFSLKNLYNKNIMMKKLIFKTAKAAFKKAYRKHKSEVKRAKKVGTPVVPYNLIKADIKRKIRGTKFTSAAEIKATPGLRRRIITRIERSKRKRTPGGRPQIFGKAYASDKRGKGLQINPLSKKDRIKIQDEISQSVRKFLKRRKDEPQSFKSGGIKKMLIGGLLTKGIKGAAKRYFKSGRKTSEIVKKEGGTRAEAKKDVRSGIRDELKSDFRVVDKKFQADKNNQLIRMKRRIIISDLNKVK